MADDWQDALVGAWHSAPGGGLAFAATSQPEPVWRVTLPESLDQARAALDVRSEMIGLSEQAVQVAERRVLAFARSLGDESARSFAPDQPEAILLRDTRILEAATRGAGTRSTFLSGAYAVPDSGDIAEQQEASSQWQRWLAQVRELVSNYARIETEQGAHTIGVTRVGWTGSFDTIWQADGTRDAAALHLHNVQTALASRLVMVRLASVVGTGAAEIAIRLFTPGMQLLLLPAVWRFVRDVVGLIRASGSQVVRSRPT